METLNKKKKGSKPLTVAFIAMGVAAAIYSLIFPLHRWQHYLIAAGVMFLVGRVAYIMSQGVDTTKEAPEQQPIPKTGDSAVDSLVEKGQEMLKEIRKENDLIPDAELSEKMDKLEDVANRIFHTVAEQPQKAPQIRRFMNYYLPTTLKMLSGYRKMDERQVSGKNAQATRDQIRSAMDVVLQAFDKQLDALYQDDMLDISTDIDVMETMLRQDGLIDSGWNAQKVYQVQQAYQAQQEKNQQSQQTQQEKTQQTQQAQQPKKASSIWQIPLSQQSQQEKAQGQAQAQAQQTRPMGS